MQRKVIEVLGRPFEEAELEIGIVFQQGNTGQIERAIEIYLDSLSLLDFRRDVTTTHRFVDIITGTVQKTENGLNFVAGHYTLLSGAEKKYFIDSVITRFSKEAAKSDPDLTILENMARLMTTLLCNLKAYTPAEHTAMPLQEIASAFLSLLDSEHLSQTLEAPPDSDPASCAIGMFIGSVLAAIQVSHPELIPEDKRGVLKTLAERKFIPERMPRDRTDGLTSIKGRFVLG